MYMFCFFFQKKEGHALNAKMAHDAESVGFFLDRMNLNS